MKNIVAILGVVALLSSCVVMGSTLMLPSLLTPFSSFFCEKDEQLTGEVWTVGNEMRSSTGTTYLCVSESGEERAVTPQVISRATNVFLLLMFGGMGLLAVSGWRALKNEPSRTPSQKAKRKNDDTAFNEPQVFQTGDGVTVVTASGSVSQSDVTNASEMTKQLFDMMNDIAPPMKTGEKFDLTDALKELEQARSSGLISETEYQNMRQKIMDKFA